MHGTRYLIVNADDFGQSPGVNRGIIQAHEHGIVTSASLMVRWPAAVEAAAYARSHARLGVGLHVDLGEWAHRDGAWAPVYEVVPAGEPEAVASEVARQLAAFRVLIGRDPTHLDSHQHVHHSEPLRTILAELGRERAIPVRGLSQGVRYCGDFYGQTGKGERYPDGISVAHLVTVLASMPSGVTELACHPGSGTDVDSMYRAERAREVDTLCHPQVRAAVVSSGIKLVSFADLSRI
jgi:predicted glycoside hydrolase/deacetylase ChbG (UPF0249 family)